MGETRGGGLAAAALVHSPELLELQSTGAWVTEILVVAPGGGRLVVPLRKPFLVVSRVELGRWALDRAARAGAEVLRPSVPPGGSPGNRVAVPPTTFGREALDGALEQYRLAEAGTSRLGLRGGAVLATSRWKRGGFVDLGSRNHVLLGDAAGLADPATGEGIDNALRSAAVAAHTYDPHAGFAGYPAALRRALLPEIRRARVIRRWLYGPGVPDTLVRLARRSPRGALLLMSLVDAINEHGTLVAALRRAAAGQKVDLGAAREVCACPDDVGASAPVPA